MSSLIRSVNIGSMPVSVSFDLSLSWAYRTVALYCCALNFSNRSGRLTPNDNSWSNISYSFCLSNSFCTRTPTESGMASSFYDKSMSAWADANLVSIDSCTACVYTGRVAFRIHISDGQKKESAYYTFSDEFVHPAFQGHEGLCLQEPINAHRLEVAWEIGQWSHFTDEATEPISLLVLLHCYLDLYVHGRLIAGAEHIFAHPLHIYIQHVV